MEEMMFQGRPWTWTWTNNWQEEGFIEAKLDRIFGASKWLLENEGAVVKHVAR